MKITYDILWFDDQPASIEAYQTVVIDLLAESGFRTKIDLQSSISEDEISKLSTRLSQYNKYDLIIFDCDLGSKSKSGDEIAKSLRSKIYTDMVFYSGKGSVELRKILFNKQVDGVFLVDKATFQNEIIPILEDHIKKLCDLCTMRGIVMEQIANIERMMRSKCREILNGKSDEDRMGVLRKIQESVAERAKLQTKRINEQSDPASALDDPLLTEFNTVRSRLYKLCNGHSSLAEGSDLFKNQKLRNDLAHRASSVNSEGKLVLEGSPAQEFNFERFKQIRSQLLSIEAEIERI